MNKRPALMPGAIHELHCQVPREMRDQIWAAARAADLSPSQWIRRAIRDQLAKEEEVG